MRFAESSHTYHSDWESVTAAFWIKYPSENAKHVKSVDTLSREIDPENKLLKQKRMLYLEYNMPAWMERVFNRKMDGLVLEESVVDFENKTLELKSKQLTLGRFLDGQEICSYKQNPDDPNFTDYTTRLEVSVKVPEAFQNVFGIKSLLESQLLKNGMVNAQNGYSVMAEKVNESVKLYPEAEWREICTEIQNSYKDKYDTIRNNNCNLVQALSNKIADSIESTKNSISSTKDLIGSEIEHLEHSAEEKFERLKSFTKEVGDISPKRIADANFERIKTFTKENVEKIEHFKDESVEEIRRTMSKTQKSIKKQSIITTAVIKANIENKAHEIENDEKGSISESDVNVLLFEPFGNSKNLFFNKALLTSIWASKIAAGTVALESMRSKITSSQTELKSDVISLKDKVQNSVFEAHHELAKKAEREIQEIQKKPGLLRRVGNFFRRVHVPA